MEFVKGYVRDPVSHVLINNDEREYREHKFKMDLSTKINSMQNEIDQLRLIVSQLQAKVEEKN